MGLLKQLMIFGKSGLQGLPLRVALFLWAFSRQGATGVPLFTLGEGLLVGGPGTPPFGARGRSSVRYGTRLGDLKENWFLLFSN
jgi:hypothetical protein